jgi:transcription-repair coupling factor (superfamily II helicase)
MEPSRLYEYLSTAKESERASLLVVSDDKSAIQAAAVCRYLQIEPFVLPQLRVSHGEDLRSYLPEIRELFVVLADYYMASEPRLLIAPVYTLSFPLPKAKYFDSLQLEFGQTLDLELFRKRLCHWGYHFVDLVSEPGEVSIRGDIIDLYSPGSDTPWRIGLFDEEIESIHPFDIDTQKRYSDKEMETIVLRPAFLALGEEDYEALCSRVETSPHESFVKNIDSLGLWHLEELGEDLLRSMQAIAAEDLSEELNELYTLNSPLIPRESYPASRIPPSELWRDLEVADPNKLIEAHRDKRITIIARNESVVRGSHILYHGLSADDSVLHRESSHDKPGLRYVYQEGIFNLLGPDELILSLNKPLKHKRVRRPSLILDEMRPGEYVVHESHGVGIFRGIEKREILGTVREFVVMEYQGGDSLLVPVENLEVIDRYVAEGGTLPVLDRLGKASFKRLKGKVREKLFAIASQIINLSAQRLMQRGVVLHYDPAEMSAFKAKAGFEHTEDQNKAIEEILKDLSSGFIMDRLLSADVGFGKTEVAMNAIFAAVRSGYQALMIVPTTLLSAQHYRSLQERFAPWGIDVAQLDRYTSAKAKREIFAGLEEGTIPVAVGTHALLGARFKNLALVVVDEEHKFGVKQKEALKEMAVDVHLLSMSATPIPRSLNLALSKIKSFSEILTPPVERVGVRTFVKSFDPKVVKEAILRERRRGGQIFYIYNSIAGIEEKAAQLREIVPDLRMGVLHSRISALVTEKEMMKFEAGEYDLLLSTTIVESGIHLPNANTMIVDGSENFGIADLHQLRGRVGRGGKEGYCYLLVEDKEHLGENARRRLLALETHSELGSGAVLAFHDLEIRGGGNIIGEAQSGHIRQIGYSLYLRMLEDAIRELSGKKTDSDKHSVDIRLQVDAYLSDQLISEDRLRLELYRRLSQAGDTAEVYEIEEEITDRFGTPDRVTRRFIDLMVIKVMAKEQGISKISNYEDKIFVEFHGEKEREIFKSESRDHDDIIMAAMRFLRKKR